MASRLVHSSSSRGLSSSPTPPLPNQHHHQNHNHTGDGLLAASGPEPRNGLEADEVDKSAPVPYLPQLVVLCEQRHEPEGIDEAAAAAAGPSTSGLVSKWRPKDRVMDVMQIADAVSSDVILRYSLNSATPVLGGIFGIALS